MARLRPPPGLGLPPSWPAVPSASSCAEAFGAPAPPSPSDEAAPEGAGGSGSEAAGGGRPRLGFAGRGAGLLSMGTGSCPGERVGVVLASGGVVREAVAEADATGTFALPAGDLPFGALSLQMWRAVCVAPPGVGGYALGSSAVLTQFALPRTGDAT